MSNEIVALISVVIAVVAILLTLWQNILTRRATQSQVLLSLKEHAKDANYFDGMAAIMALKNYANFEAFQKAEPKENQKKIYETVDFLNFIAHLVEDEFLPRQTLWNYYFHAYRICNDKLMPWWLAGIRQSRFQGFTGLEKMCKRVGSISNADINKHEEKFARA